MQDTSFAIPSFFLQIRRDIEDGIDSTVKKMTLCQLYAKQNAQRANVKKSTQKQREQLMRLLKEDKLGARSIDTIKGFKMILDGHSLVKVLCGTKLPTTIIIADHH